MLVPVCSLMWDRTLALNLNIMPQILQVKGRSPVCFTMWILAAHSRGKRFGQYGHRYSFSSALRSMIVWKKKTWLFKKNALNS